MPRVAPLSVGHALAAVPRPDHWPSPWGCGALWPPVPLSPRPAPGGDGGLAALEAALSQAPLLPPTPVGFCAVAWRSGGAAPSVVGNGAIPPLNTPEAASTLGARSPALASDLSSDLGVRVLRLMLLLLPRRSAAMRSCERTPRSPCAMVADMGNRMKLARTPVVHFVAPLSSRSFGDPAALSQKVLRTPLGDNAWTLKYTVRPNTHRAGKAFS